MSVSNSIAVLFAGLLFLWLSFSAMQPAAQLTTPFAGNANFDDLLDISDAQLLVDMLGTTATLTDLEMLFADANADGEIDELDILLIVDTVLGYETPKPIIGSPITVVSFHFLEGQSGKITESATMSGAVSFWKVSAAPAPDATAVLPAVASYWKQEETPSPTDVSVQQEGTPSFYRE